MSTIGDHYIRVVQITGGAGGSGSWTSVTQPNGDIIFTDSLSGTTFTIPVPLKTRLLEDVDGDTKVELIENGGAEPNADKMNFVVDGVTVGSVEIIAGGITKWTLDGILDPIVYAGTPRTIVQRDALTAIKGYMVYVSDGAIEEYQYYNGATWKTVGATINNTLTSTSTVEALSANQGKVLQDTKVNKPTLLADAGKMLVVNATGTDVEYISVDADEVIESTIALTGAAPLGAKYGIDTVTGLTYYVSGGNWVESPVSTDAFWSTDGNTSTATKILGSTDNTVVNIQSGTGNLNIGADAGAKAITIGNQTGATGLTFNSGTDGEAHISTANVGGIHFFSANNLANGSVLNAISTSTSKIANATGLDARVEGALTSPNITTYGASVQNTHTGTGLTNVGLRVTASGGTNNYGLLVTGNTGIGTATPTETLTVGGNVFTNVDNTGIAVGANTTSSIGLIKKLGTSGSISAGVAQPIIFSHSDQSNVLSNIGTAVFTERMRISPTTGNVGIGLATPTTKLEVNGEIKGTRLIANGAGAITSNVAVGGSSLIANTTGTNNTAVGFQALLNATTGSNNVAVGGNALQSATTASNNVVVGANALRTNITGSSNIAVGGYALVSATGNSNISIGNNSSFGMTTGIQNVGIGGNALSNNTTGSNNTIIGHNTGAGIVTGGSNTIIGANVTGLASGLSGNIIIADGSGNQRINVDGSGKVGIGTTSPTSQLHTTGSEASAAILIASATTLGEHRYIWASAVGTYLVTLPNPTTCAGRVYSITTTSSAKTISTYTDLSNNTNTTLPVNTTITLVSVGGFWKQF